VMDLSRAWGFPIPGRWTSPARGKDQFLS